MISNNELYQLLLKLPLSSADIGRLYQYLTSKGGGGGSEGIEDILKLIPADATEINKLVTEKKLKDNIEEATDAEVQELLNK